MYVQAEVEEDHLDQRHEGYSDAYLFLAQYYIEKKVCLSYVWVYKLFQFVILIRKQVILEIRFE